MDKKTILLVANSTWNIFNFRLNVIDRLLSEGYKVVILAPVDEYIEYKEKYPSVKHYNLKMLDRDSTNPLNDLALTLELIRKYTKIKPDLILHYTNKPNIFGGIAARTKHIKSIAMVTGLGYAFIHDGMIRKVLTMLYRWTSPYHRKFIFENIDDRLLFEKLNIIPPDKGVSIKGCGVDSNYFISKSDDMPEDTTFTFIGRLLYDKGIKEFVNAAKIIKQKFPSTKFVVIGEIDPDNPATIDTDELNTWINMDIVDYHGFQRDVRPFIRSSTCIVLPSYREAIPRTITEAMSMSKPVITTDVAGCKEAVMHGKNGYLVASKSVKELSEAMKSIINKSKEELQEMGRKGREMVELYFDDKIVAEDIVNICNEVLDE